MTNEDINHLAFSILHGTFDRDATGGCSCADCAALLVKIDDLAREEGAKFYAEHYPPAGGLL